jgi:hypothetical protein
MEKSPLHNRNTFALSNTPGTRALRPFLFINAALIIQVVLIHIYDGVAWVKTMAQYQPTYFFHCPPPRLLDKSLPPFQISVSWHYPGKVPSPKNG